MIDPSEGKYGGVKLMTLVLLLSGGRLFVIRLSWKAIFMSNVHESC